MRVSEVESALRAAVVAINTYRRTHGLPLRLRLSAAATARQIADGAHVLWGGDRIMSSSTITKVHAEENAMLIADHPPCF